MESIETIEEKQVLLKGLCDLTLDILTKTIKNSKDNVRLREAHLMLQMATIQISSILELSKITLYKNELRGREYPIVTFPKIWTV